MKPLTVKMFGENKKEVTKKAKALCKKWEYKRVVAIEPISERIRFLQGFKKQYLVTFEV